jgi:hypothetical protein
MVGADGGDRLGQEFGEVFFSHALGEGVKSAGMGAGMDFGLVGERYMHVLLRHDMAGGGTCAARCVSSHCC